MRTFLKTVLVLVVAILATACAGKKAQVAPMTLDELRVVDPEGAAILEAQEARVRELAVLRQQEKDLATAKKAIVKADTPQMRKARNDIKRAEARSGRILRNEARAKSNSGLFCPVDSDISKVWVHNSVTQGFGTYSNMSVTNLSNVPVHIIRKTGGTTGVVVQNLYPGCTMSLKQRRGITSGGTVGVSYKAVPSSGSSSGGQEFSDSPVLYTYPCYGTGCQLEFPGEWKIMFHR